MPKKLDKQNQLPMLRESANQIWLAGLGALSIAEDESGKIFRTLVKRGKAFEPVVKDRFDEVKGKFDMKKSATDSVDRIGERVSASLDEGMTNVLHRLGLPTMKEIEGLTKRVERLTRTLEAKPARPNTRRLTPRKRIAATTGPTA